MASSHTATATPVVALRSEPNATPARRAERSWAAMGGFVAIGLGLSAVLGVLALALSTPRIETPPTNLPVSGSPPTAGHTPSGGHTLPPAEEAQPVEGSAQPEALPGHADAPPAPAEALTGDPTAPAEPSDAETDPPDTSLEDPREEPTTEAAAFPALDDDHGTLEILCRPAAEIFVDNRSLGLTPRVVDVPDGPIAIGLRSTGPGHPWRTLRRTVAPRGTLSIPMTDCP